MILDLGSWVLFFEQYVIRMSRYHVCFSKCHTRASLLQDAPDHQMQLQSNDPDLHLITTTLPSADLSNTHLSHLPDEE